MKVRAMSNDSNVQNVQRAPGPHRTRYDRQDRMRRHYMGVQPGVLRQASFIRGGATVVATGMQRSDNRAALKRPAALRSSIFLQWMTHVHRS